MRACAAVSDLGHSPEEVLDVGQLPVVCGQKALDGVDQELQRLSAGLQLSLLLLLFTLLQRQLLLQASAGTAQPIRAADGEVQHRALQTHTKLTALRKSSLHGNNFSQIRSLRHNHSASVENGLKSRGSLVERGRPF